MMGYTAFRAIEKQTGTRLAICSAGYRGQPGHLITGHDTKGRQVSVWAPTRDAAERLRDKIRAGAEIPLADFQEVAP